ncbi:MAG: ABC transporter permease [Rhizobiaceae bacterium]
MSRTRLLWRLVITSLWSRRLAVLFVVFAVAVSTVLYLSVERLRVGAWQSFSSTVAGTDLIVGARSGSVQLMLYSVFRIGNATNNITVQSVRDIEAMQDVAWTVPLSLGDAHQGYRVVGTNAAYFERYRYGRDRRLELAQGANFADLFDVVLGSEVAKALDYGIGDRVVVAHGLGRAGLVRHDDLPFAVSGILSPTGTPVDRSLHFSLPAITAIRVDWSTGARARNTTPADILRKRAAAGELEADAVTALLVGTKNKLSVFRTARAINDYSQEPLLAVLPGVALQELWTVIGTAERALSAVASMVVLTAIIGLVATILATLEQRRREIAILRSLGARPFVISGLLVAEAGLVTLAGLALGVIMVTIATPLASGWLRANYGLDLPVTISSTDFAVLIAILVSALIAALLPAWRAYRISLGEGLGATA